MAVWQDQLTKWWFFDSVQDLWDAQGLEDATMFVDRDGFLGRLQKGLFEDLSMTRVTSDQLAQGKLPNALMVIQVHNADRSWNWELLDPPPHRTGKFDQFMDEVEAVARREGCRYVWVDSVANEFLPAKLERRGYRRVRYEYDFPNPDYIKTLGLPG